MEAKVPPRRRLRPREVRSKIATVRPPAPDTDASVTDSSDDNTEATKKFVRKEVDKATLRAKIKTMKETRAAELAAAAQSAPIDNRPQSDAEGPTLVMIRDAGVKIQVPGEPTSPAPPPAQPEPTADDGPEIEFAEVYMDLEEDDDTLVMASKSKQAIAEDSPCLKPTLRVPPPAPAQPEPAANNEAKQAAAKAKPFNQPSLLEQLEELAREFKEDNNTLPPKHSLLIKRGNSDHNPHNPPKKAKKRLARRKKQLPPPRRTTWSKFRRSVIVGGIYAGLLGNAVIPANEQNPRREIPAPIADRDGAASMDGVTIDYCAAPAAEACSMTPEHKKKAGKLTHLAVDTSSEAFAKYLGNFRGMDGSFISTLKKSAGNTVLEREKEETDDELSIRILERMLTECIEHASSNKGSFKYGAFTSYKRQLDEIKLQVVPKEKGAKKESLEKVLLKGGRLYFNLKLMYDGTAKNMKKVVAPGTIDHYRMQIDKGPGSAYDRLAKSLHGFDGNPLPFFGKLAAAFTKMQESKLKSNSPQYLIDKFFEFANAAAEKSPPGDASLSVLRSYEHAAKNNAGHPIPRILAGATIAPVEKEDKADDPIDGDPTTRMCPLPEEGATGSLFDTDRSSSRFASTVTSLEGDVDFSDYMDEVEAEELATGVCDFNRYVPEEQAEKLKLAADKADATPSRPKRYMDGDKVPDLIAELEAKQADPPPKKFVDPSKIGELIAKAEKTVAGSRPESPTPQPKALNVQQVTSKTVSNPSETSRVTAPSSKPSTSDIVLAKTEEKSEEKPQKSWFGRALGRVKDVAGKVAKATGLKTETPYAKFARVTTNRIALRDHAAHAQEMRDKFEAQERATSEGAARQAAELEKSASKLVANIAKSKAQVKKEKGGGLFGKLKFWG
jgi:hypothetical protein